MCLSAQEGKCIVIPEKCLHLYALFMLNNLMLTFSHSNGSTDIGPISWAQACPVHGYPVTFNKNERKCIEYLWEMWNRNDV